MKIGLICDSHMPDNPKSAQWQYCLMAAERFKADNVSDVITLGDITSFGELRALDAYVDMMSEFNHHYVLGNSDVRDKNTADKIISDTSAFRLEIDSKVILGINTPYAKLEETDKAQLLGLNDGDIVVMHHPIERLFDEDSRNFMEELCREKALTILFAHLHRKISANLGKSKLLGIRAIDPDKSFGDYPCVTYFDTETYETEECLLKVSSDVIWDAFKYFGISCVDNHRDVQYAIDNKLYAVELRCNGKGWEPDMTLVPKIQEWREVGGKYLSIHMPNLYWVDGEVVGVDTWYKAVEYANAVDVDGLTMHPPRVKLCDFENADLEFLELYKYAVNNVDEKVKIGVENLHMHKGEADDFERAFGYIPSEVAHWRNEMSAAVNNSNTIGHTIDVGHARNNGVLASKYPISRWYEAMGKFAVAYHIHQVMTKDGVLKNHNAIEDWFGPQISYASFFYLWGKSLINHAPIFLEVKGAENFDKSIKAFRKVFFEK